MKKIISLLIISVVFLSGCEAVGKGEYKEGTYYGFVETESYGSKYITSAVVYINTSGSIKSVFIDSTYVKDAIVSTKKALGDAYGMKATSATVGNIEGGAEWYTQIEVLEKKIVEEQGIDWVKYQDDNSTLDSVSGVTIKASDYISAVSKSLEQAK